MKSYIYDHHIKQSNEITGATADRFGGLGHQFANNVQHKKNELLNETLVL